MGGPLAGQEGEDAMAKGFRSGIAHAGWLHKLVGKTPLDVHWKKYWVSHRCQLPKICQRKCGRAPRGAGGYDRMGGWVGGWKGRAWRPAAPPRA